MIEVQNVTKKFRIWEDRSRDFKETAINFLKGKRRSFRDVWALRGINLSIGGGETVAFIGENGSGKSTLLKLLCRIYAPDEGKIVTGGKVSALLELGVGFHPDLTGEENIYLNGAMLGFDRIQMRKRFDEIVSFAEIGDFIYSPIRTYSSGMAMRLGFSVAMCVDPDVLLIDEVLAVGDAAFQEKCVRKLEEFKLRGKTIVIVSHAMEVIEEFCDRAVLLHEGQIVSDGDPKGVIDQYLSLLSFKQEGKAPASSEDHELRDEKESQEVSSFPPAEAAAKGEQAEKEGEAQGDEGQIVPEEEGKGEDKETGALPRGDEEIALRVPEHKRHGTFEAEITGVMTRTEKGEQRDFFFSGEMISIRLHIRFHQEIKDPNVGMAILKGEDGRQVVVYSTNTLRKEMKLGLMKKDDEMVVEFVQRACLSEGDYYLTVAITNSCDSTIYDWHDNLKSFQIRKLDSRWGGMVDLNSEIMIRR